MKPQHVPKLAAIFPSMLVALVHLVLSVRVAPHANVVFQRWFDTGEQPSGADAVVASINNFLSKPIPALLFATHPVNGLAPGWWVATIANSIVWGLAIYVAYIIAARILKEIAQ